jgi:zinc transporter 2
MSKKEEGVINQTPSTSLNVEKPTLMVSDKNQAKKKDSPSNHAHVARDEEKSERLPGDHPLWYDPSKDPDNTHKVKRILCMAMGVVFIFITAEVIGGLISGSLAILADASHLACDLVGQAISYTAVHLGTKAKTDTMTFGYHRAQIVGALASVLLILVMAGVLVYCAILRIITPPADFEPWYMFGTAVFGLCCN